MKLTKLHWIGLIAAAVIIGLAFALFWKDKMFFFISAIGVISALLPFLMSLISESKIEQEKNERFLEFARNLAESVKTGTPIGKSIINMSSKDFGSLSPHIKKLANQISLGIPIGRALETFAFDINSVVIRRAISLIREAENAGGDIEHILDSTAESIYQIEKLKRERKAAISSLVVQGYIIFLIFVGIMLIMQFKVLPLTASAGGIASIQSIEQGSANVTVDVKALARPFLYLLLVQGFFTGITIGKLSEGSLRAGIKHSAIMLILAFLITSGAEAFVGTG